MKPPDFRRGMAIAILRARPYRGLLLQLNPNEQLASTQFSVSFPGQRARVVCICCIDQEQVHLLPKLLAEKPDVLELMVKFRHLWGCSDARKANAAAPEVKEWPFLAAHLTEVTADALAEYQRAIDRVQEEYKDAVEKGEDGGPALMARMVSRTLGGLEADEPTACGPLPHVCPNDAADKAAEEERFLRRTGYRAPTLRDSFRKGGRR